MRNLHKSYIAHFFLYISPSYSLLKPQVFSWVYGNFVAIWYSGSIAWWGMPTEAYALCQIVPHVTEKGYSSIFEFFSNTQNFCVNSVGLQRLISTIPLGPSSFFQILQIAILSFFGFLGSQKKSKAVGRSRTRGDDFHSRCQSSSIIRRISTFLGPVFLAYTDNLRCMGSDTSCSASKLGVA